MKSTMHCVLMLFLLPSIANSALQCNWTTFGHDNFFTHEADGFLSAPFSKPMVVATAPVKIRPSVKPILYNNKFYIFDVYNQFWVINMDLAALGNITMKSYLSRILLDFSADETGRVYALGYTTEPHGQTDYTVQIYDTTAPHNPFNSPDYMPGYIDDPRNVIGTGTQKYESIVISGYNESRPAFGELSQGGGGVYGQVPLDTVLPDVSEIGLQWLDYRTWAVRGKKIPSKAGEKTDWQLLVSPDTAQISIDLNNIMPSQIITNPCGNATAIITDADVHTLWAAELSIDIHGRTGSASFSQLPVDYAAFTSVETDKSHEACSNGKVFRGLFVATTDARVAYIDTRNGFRYTSIYYNVTLEKPLISPLVVATDKSVFGLTTDSALIGLTKKGANIFEPSPIIPGVLPNVTRPIVCDNLIYLVTDSQVMVLGQAPFVVVPPFFNLGDKLTFNLSADQSLLYPEGTFITSCFVNGTQVPAKRDGVAVTCQYDTSNVTGGAFTLSTQFEWVVDDETTTTANNTGYFVSLEGLEPNCISPDRETRVVLKGFGLDLIAKNAQQWNCFVDGEMRYAPTYSHKTGEVSCLVDGSWLQPDQDTEAGLRYVYNGQLYNMVAPFKASNKC